ncbi:hypothetical protein [Acidicapsa ligni]|uniref:hypothetical protein n=1 Tax=Acidicapsa ligni TaxID=542300 RepID=UPI0021DFD00B|nr:hypothetical protein [Acidicapsa ligni]
MAGFVASRRVKQIPCGNDRQNGKGNGECKNGKGKDNGKCKKNEYEDGKCGLVSW